MRYRLVKRTRASGAVVWVIQRKLFIVGWDFVDAFSYERNARETLDKLRTGVPSEKTEVIDE